MTPRTVSHREKQLRRKQRLKRVRQGGKAVGKVGQSIQNLERLRHHQFFHGSLPGPIESLLHFSRGAALKGGTQFERASAPGTAGTPAGKVLNRLIVQTPTALAEHPGAIPKTGLGLAKLPLGIPAATVETILHPKRTAAAISDDFNRRYMKGTDAQFRKRIGKEGATAEVADALTLASGAGTSLGRGFGRAARAGNMGERLQKVASEERPRLRVSGGKTVPQDLSPNLLRASLQRWEDTRRAKRTEHLARGGTKRGLQPEQRDAALHDAGQRLQRHLVGEADARAMGDKAAARDHRAAGKQALDEVRHAQDSAGPGEVVPLFQKRRLRIEASKVQTRHFLRFRSERVKHIDRGVMRALGKLSRKQRQATFHVLQGLVTPDNPTLAIAQLTRRRARIVAEYQRRGFHGIPREAKTIDFLIGHADEVFGDGKLRKLLDTERARHEEIGHAGVADSTAEARRHRPQAEELGISYGYEQAKNAIEKQRKQGIARARDANEAAAVRHEADQALKELEAQKPEIDRRFAEQVRQAAEKAGLPEPVYLQHFKHRVESESRAAFGVGGRRAAAAPKMSSMELFRAGLADTHPKAYVQSVARTIKRRHNWALVAEQADTHAFRLPNEQEIVEAFGHKHIDPKQLTGEQWRTVLEHRGWDPKDYALWAPGRFQRSMADHAAADQALHLGREDAIDLHEMRGVVDDSFTPMPKEGEPLPAGFQQQEGVRLIPREVYDEIHSAVQGSSTGGRLVDKIQGLQSATLLGTNPSWLAMQVGANLFISALKTRGNVSTFIRAPAFYRRMAREHPEALRELDDLTGTGAAEAHGHRVRLGAAANNRLVDGYRGLREALGFKFEAFKNSVPLLRNVPTFNPIHMMFALDNAQNRYFKRVVLYDEMRRQAFADMARHGEVAFKAQGVIADMLKLDPKKRLEQMIQDPETIIRQAEAVDNVLGNWVRYTAKERRTLKRYVIFYGFLRYSLRLTFYTMPVKHPVTASIIAKLTQLHNQEVSDLLGGDDTPWAFSRIYSGVRYNKQKGKFEFKDPAVRAGRKPAQSVDLARLNPASNPAIDVANEGPKALLSFTSPAVQIALDQAYGVNSFTGQRFKVGGSPKEVTDLPLFSGARGRIVLNQVLSLVAPYRMAGQSLHPEKQTDDTLLWDPKPIHYKTHDKLGRPRPQGVELNRRQRELSQSKGSPPNILLHQLVPFLPRPDNTVAGAKALKKKKRGSSSSGGNLFSPSGGGGGGSSSGSF